MYQNRKCEAIGSQTRWPDGVLGRPQAFSGLELSKLSFDAISRKRLRPPTRNRASMTRENNSGGSPIPNHSPVPGPSQEARFQRGTKTSAPPESAQEPGGQHPRGGVPARE